MLLLKKGETIMKKDKNNRKNKIKDAFVRPIRNFRGEYRDYFEGIKFIALLLGGVLLLCFLMALPTILTLSFQNVLLTCIVLVISVPWSIYLYKVFSNLVEILD